MALQIVAGGGGVRMTKRTANGVTDVDATEGEKKIKVHDDPQQGVKVEITTTKEGKEVTEKFEAPNADELKKKAPEAHKIYEKYMQNQAPGFGRIQICAGGAPAIKPIPVQPVPVQPSPGQPAPGGLLLPPPQPQPMVPIGGFQLGPGMQLQPAPIPALGLGQPVPLPPGQIPFGPGQPVPVQVLAPAGVFGGNLVTRADQIVPMIENLRQEIKRLIGDEVTLKNASQQSKDELKKSIDQLKQQLADLEKKLDAKPDEAEKKEQKKAQK